MDNAIFQERNFPERANWSAVFAMTLCVFVLIASEFMPVSLLTPLALDFQVTEGMAGQGITISGIFAVITSLFISALTHNLNRKTLLLGLTVLMGVSGAMIALASNYYIYMVGRALIGIVVGGFWSMSAAIAMRLVPIDQVPKALAIFNSGNALATVIAAPLGAYLGSTIGWRGAFLGLVPIAIATILWLWVSLPSMPTDPNIHQNTPQIFSIFSFFKYRVITLGMLAIGLFFMGQFTLFTYVRPFLETVVKVDISMVTFSLLLIGITGFIGTLLINRVLKIGFYQTLIAIPLLMASIAVSLIFFGYSSLTSIVLLSIWGFIATAAPVGWWSWIPRIFSNSAEAGGGLMVAVIQLSIACGASVGGIIFDLMGYESTFAVSALFLVVAAILVQCTAKAEKEK
ncbi:MFS transporter [Providencia hangzhouensis]|uniref:Purine ribonucleoside efflux pump nepI n=1 Tax=Providencia rettgeri TaxID=587 RepID=A0A9N8GY38_PRORE|nr:MULTISPECIES: MFS transporter [Providencia]MBN7840145.1 MFS transporter [Providencia rettgeri]MBN7853035.1 MFS transporter [Providencia rettgeri]MBN7861122.1 MFS transporter [Providencia rettgeri]MBN7871379.1 MFS transporter [Providencia rettgeri]MBN7897590.1 MFS transporter [Providencia rettgeri]